MFDFTPMRFCPVISKQIYSNNKLYLEKRVALNQSRSSFSLLIIT